jgi:hypothetical protein
MKILHSIFVLVMNFAKVVVSSLAFVSSLVAPKSGASLKTACSSVHTPKEVVEASRT